ncbi:biliverdin-producing heme oxygenase [Sphingomonas sp. MMS12-HWE2-04]|uniref:biliverdin-producing heme oxygenase n=1 Tax=Sphingomonas sp. MMS12-HWE2-04 TaxID=3234199 RepID=UPI00384FDCA0
MSPTHKKLREGTATAHARVDAAFAGFDLTDRADYARFLMAHAELVWPLEAALPGDRIVEDWEARKRGDLLHEDLAFLRPAPHPAEAPAERWVLDSDAQVAGTLYVLEGSRLGGRFIARSLPSGFPRAYLDAHQGADKWQQLLQRIDAILQEPAALNSALASAHAAFAAFERSAARWAKG